MTKDERKQINEDINDLGYMVRRLLAVFLGIAVVAGAALYALEIGGMYTLGKWHKDAERYVFKSSVAYNEQAASFLAKSYKEYNEAEDQKEKAAIMEYVAIRYPNLDVSGIENAKLKAFYLNCIG